MLEKSTSNLTFPSMGRVKQKNNSYCGPAVLEMLYSFLGRKVGQEEIVQAAKISRKIKSRGMLVEEMALAIKTLTPEYNFWSKRKSQTSELSEIVNRYNFPVGVEWQGVFKYKGLREDDEDDDPGHYSVVTQISVSDKKIFLADPFRVYAGRDREFTLLEFERRWWDINEIVDRATRKKKQMDDYHLMFIIVPKESDFPARLGMRLG